MVAVNQRVQKHRESLRQAGLRPVQLWVPDTRRPDFVQECARQSQLVAQADGAQTQDVDAWLDNVVHDVEGWTA